MDIGNAFEDDFFDDPKEKILKESSNYAPKFCTPLWFMDTKKGNQTPEEELVSLKHQSDYHYFSKNFPKAAELYEQCLYLTPPANNTWKREFMENLARCFLQMDKADKALEWSLKLDESSFSADQKIISMNLLAMVCHKLKKFKEELEALHCCLEVHKSCPEFWQRLALCYAGLFNFHLPAYSAAKNVSEEGTEPCCGFNAKMNCPVASEDDASADSRIQPIGAIPPSAESSEKLTHSESAPECSKCDVCTLGIQIVSSCLIHTKMLIDSGGPNIIGAENDKQALEKITCSLKHMEVEQSFIEVASTMLGSDFLAGLQACGNNIEQQHGKPMKDGHEKDEAGG